jgi:hypothetical protein
MLTDGDGTKNNPYRISLNGVVDDTELIKEKPVVVQPNINVEYKDNEANINIEFDNKYVNQYSLDLGSTWIEYSNPITVEENTTVIARTIDSNNNVLSSSSFTITKLVNEENNDIEEIATEEDNNIEKIVDETLTTTTTIRKEDI